MYDLIKIANDLDEQGLSQYADAIDTVLAKMKENKKKPLSGVKPYGATGRLSTRYCPDHPGTQVEIIPDSRSVQCPMDGKVYNYLEGYTTYDGQKHPGGSVDKQTPDNAYDYVPAPKFLEVE
jgi:hypothetical protein